MDGGRAISKRNHHLLPVFFHPPSTLHPPHTSPSMCTLRRPQHWCHRRPPDHNTGEPSGSLLKMATPSTIKKLQRNSFHGSTNHSTARQSKHRRRFIAAPEALHCNHRWCSIATPRLISWHVQPERLRLHRASKFQTLQDHTFEINCILKRHACRREEVAAVVCPSG